MGFLEKMEVRGTKNGRPRISALDILGTVADIGAEWGGETGGYQSGIDQRRVQQENVQDRAWKERQNQQKFEAGQGELSEQRVSRMGQAARGLRQIYGKQGVAGLSKALPMVGRMIGLLPEDMEILQGSFASDPEGTLEVLETSATPTSSGSQPKELAIYEILQRQDKANGTDLAPGYLSRVASGGNTGEMTEYQRQSLRIREDEARSKRGARERIPAKGSAKTSAAETKAAVADQQRVSAARSARTVINEMRSAFGVLRDSGGINAPGQDMGGRIGALAKENVPFLERLTSPEGFSAREDLDRLRTQGITSLIPLLGGLQLGGKNIDAAKELDTWRKAIASASDYPSAMRALDGFQRRIDEILSQSTSPAPRASAPRSSTTPRRRISPRTPEGSNSGVKRLRYDPTTGELK